MKNRKFILVAAIAVLAVLTSPAVPVAQQATTVVLAPTNHPQVPADLAQLWMAPDSPRAPRSPALVDFVSGVKLEVAGNFSKALGTFSQPPVQAGTLGDYAVYYKGLAQMRLGRTNDARVTFHALGDRGPVGYLAEAAALREAEADETLGDESAALTMYERLSLAKTTSPDDVLMRVGRVAKAAGDMEKAATAFSRVYFEYPFSELAVQASAELDHFSTHGPIAAGSNRYKLELARAERLFAAKRYGQARSAFESLRPAAQGDDSELVHLRIAECDYFLKRPRNARDEAHPYIDTASRQGEALFFYAVATHDVGNHDEYLRLARRVADEFPTQTWSEEALNSLATFHIQQNDDAKADELFREMYQRFPSGRYAERAAWKIGWRAFRSGAYADTVWAFETGAVQFPRSDYRPAWLYWAGRAHEALSEKASADARYTLTATDYLNSYYGRLALKRLDGRAPERRLVISAGEARLAASDEAAPVFTLPPNAPVIRALLGVKLYDQAIDELHYAQKTGDESPAIGATLAWIYAQQGQDEKGAQQFNLFRAAINTMKSAYPQFMAAGGEGLPKELLRVIFPIGYWDLIRKYSAEYHLDPYLVAALTAQESTFVADIHSYANAVGLMQLMAPTAKQYARVLKLKYTPRLLTNPEANIRMGTAYLADKVKEFGEMHLVLASYNAGERPVHKWAAERSGLSMDEFIDDIPYPQTQQYVKKILGTAEDYRRLYGPDATVAQAH